MKAYFQSVALKIIIAISFDNTRHQITKVKMTEAAVIEHLKNF